VDQNDTRTWTDKFWPEGREKGILGWGMCVGPNAWENRFNENIYEIYSNLMGRKDLWVIIDRFGVMRPTKSIPQGVIPSASTRVDVIIPDDKVKDFQFEDKPDWLTFSNWLHWDLNPWKWTGVDPDVVREYHFDDFPTENNGIGSFEDGCIKLQGILNLTESLEPDGGFYVVPGFHKFISEWAQKTKNSSIYFEEKTNHWLIEVPNNEWIYTQGVKLKTRARSLVVWRSELPHCNYPNNSNRFRMVQYIRFFPSQSKGTGLSNRKKYLQRMLSSVKSMNPFRQKILGFEPWD